MESSQVWSATTRRFESTQVGARAARGPARRAAEEVVARDDGEAGARGLRVGREVGRGVDERGARAAPELGPGQEKGEKVPTLPGSYLGVVFRSFWLICGRASIPRGEFGRVPCSSLGRRFENTHVEATSNRPFPAPRSGAAARSVFDPRTVIQCVASSPDRRTRCRDRTSSRFSRSHARRDSPAAGDDDDSRRGLVGVVARPPCQSGVESGGGGASTSAASSPDSSTSSSSQSSSSSSTRQKQPRHDRCFRARSPSSRDGAAVAATSAWATRAKCSRRMAWLRSATSCS